MTRGQKKSDIKKKDLIREVNKESEEKWKGLESKLWTVAEFGFYVVLIAATIFTVGFRSSTLLSKKNYIVDPGSMHIIDKNNTVYYNVTDNCSDINNCEISTDANYKGDNINIYLSVERGAGVLKINNVILNVGPISEFAILNNGFVATFTIGEDENYINYYNNEGNLIKEYKTKLASVGKLDSDVGVYAVCNNEKMDVVKYTVKNNSDFFEELIGSYQSDQC